MQKILSRYSGIHLFFFVMELMIILTLISLIFAQLLILNSFWFNFFISLSTTIIGIMLATYIGIQIFEKYQDSKKKPYLKTKYELLISANSQLNLFLWNFLATNFLKGNFFPKMEIFSLSPTLKEIKKDFLMNDSLLSEKEILEHTIDKIKPVVIIELRKSIVEQLSNIDYLQRFVSIAPDFELISILASCRSNLQNLLLLCTTNLSIQSRTKHNMIKNSILAIFDIKTEMENYASTLISDIGIKELLNKSK